MRCIGPINPTPAVPDILHMRQSPTLGPESVAC
jgi:hypothetical protein